jgi:protein gp37
MARRFGKTPEERAFVPCFHPERMKLPEKSTAPIFLNWFSDWGCDGFSDEQREAILDLMLHNQHHVILTLSKEPARIAEFLRCNIGAPPSDFEHVMFGTSASTQSELDARLPSLCETPAANLFLMLEPLTGPVVIPPALLKKLCWVAAGAETGPAHRPCDNAWLKRVVSDCFLAGVPVFVKRLGGALHNTPREHWPNDLQFFQFPPILQRFAEVRAKAKKERTRK